MKGQLPVGPPLVLMAIGLLAAWLSTIITEATQHRIYEVARDWQTFVAAMIALGAALWAARPVYRQMQVQSAQAALDLLARVEIEIDGLTGERYAAFEVYSAAAALNGELANPMTETPIGQVSGFQMAISAFQSLHPSALMAIAGRATMHPDDRVRFTKLSDDLSKCQSLVGEFLRLVRENGNGMYTPNVLADGSELMADPLRHLANLAGRVAFDTSREETALRERARQLRSVADDFGA